MTNMKPYFVSFWVLMCALPHWVSAQEPPAWKMLTGEGFPLIQEGYPNSSQGEPSPDPGNFSTAAVGNEADEATGEIVDLARSLAHDPVTLCHWVRNNIKFSHYYGVTKGAALTLEERSGNDADTAALLVSLLRQCPSVVSAKYVFDECFLPGAGPKGSCNLADWLGIEYGDERISGYLSAGGTPFSDLYYATQDGVRWYSWKRWWVRIETETNTFDFDPSFKMIELVPGMNLSAMPGYSRAALVSAAGGSLGADSIDQIDKYAFEQEMTSQAVTFTNHVRNQFSGLDAKDIIGYYRDILVSEPLSGGYDFPLLRVDTTLASGALPESLFTKLRIRLGAVDQTIPTVRLKGRTLWAEMGIKARLYLDDTLLAEEPTSTSSYSIQFQVDVDHLGTEQDQSTGLHTLFRSGIRTIGYAFNPSVDSLRKHQAITEQLKAVGSSTARFKAQAQNVMAQMYMVQSSCARDHQAMFANMKTRLIHMIGFVTDEHNSALGVGGYYLDFPLLFSASTPRTDNPANGKNLMGSSSLFASALEHAVVAQAQNGDQAASTVRLLSGSAASPKLFQANAVNWPTIKTQLSGYSAADLQAIELYLANNWHLVLPVQGSYNVQSWSGNALIAYKFEDTGNLAFGALIGGGFKGGYSGLIEAIVTDDITIIYQTSPENQNSSSQTGSTVTGGDPVSMSTGHFVHEATDLVIGSGVMPEGLAFSWRYDGGSLNNNSSKLGYGWTHSFDLKASRTLDAELACGSGNAVDSAAYLLGLYTIYDLFSNRTNIKDWALTILAANLTANRLADNVVSVQLPDRVLQFHRQPNGSFPNGSFQSPPGCTATLIAETIYDYGPPNVPWVPTPIGETYKLQEQHGRLWSFGGANGEFTSVVDQHGKGAFCSSSTATSRTYTDCYGRSITLNYDGYQGNIGTVSDSTGRGIYFNLAPDGNGEAILAATLDTNVKFSRYSYDNQRRLTHVKNHANSVVVHNTMFDSQDRVIEQQSRGDPARTWRYHYLTGFTWEINPLGQSTIHLFDERKRNVGTFDAMERFFASEFDAQDRKVKSSTPLGHEVSMAYDANHNLLSSTDALGKTASMTYDTAKRLKTMTDATGKTATVNVYNDKHQPLTMTDPAGVVTSFTYVPAGQPGAGKVKTLRVGGALKRQWTYNAKGLVETEREGNEGTNKLVATYTYTNLGDVETITDASGAITSFIYTPKRELQYKTEKATPTSSGLTQHYVYTAEGDLESVQNPRGYTTKTLYNVVRRPFEIQLPGASKRSIGYDLADRPVTATNELNQTVTSLLNAAGQVAEVIDPLSRNSVTGYDGDGRATSLTDPLNRLTQTNYNARGEVTGRAQPDGHGLAQLYDEAGRRTHLTNRSGNTWLFGYDSGGRPSTVTTPAGRVSSTGYDAQGRVWKSTEPSGQEVRRVFDAYDRVERVDYFATSADTTPQEVVSHTYTATNQLHTTTEGAAVTARTYHPDPRHLVSSYTNAAGETLGYLFDGNSNLTRLTLPDGKQIHYAYDNRDRLTTVTDWASRVTSLQWDAASKLTKVTRPNGTVRDQIYDEAGQLTRIEERTSAGRLIQMVRLGLDAVGRAEKRMTVPLPAAASFPALNFTHTADNWITGRLYDLDGNLRQVPPVPASLGSPVMGAQPGLLDTSGTDVNATWDQRNRLMSLALADGSTLAFTYDAENLRLTKTRGGQTTRYTQNPHGIMGMSEVEIEHLPGGIKRYYVWGGPAGLLYDVAVPAGGGAETLRYYHADQVGSTLALTDSTGTATSRFDYTAYGLITRRTGDTDTPFLHNGAFGVMTDGETGLIHMRARYYHPWLARFLSEDPIGFGGGMNWYAFADGNPVMMLDALGLDAQWSQYLEHLYETDYQQYVLVLEGGNTGTYSTVPALDPIDLVLSILAGSVKSLGGKAAISALDDAAEVAGRTAVAIGEDLSSAGGTRVWRHVPEGHPALADAQAGVVKPYGTVMDAPLDARALGHDIGYTQGSGLTSWTADQAWALARQQRMGGVVLETIAPEGSVWFNQAAKGAESQALIPGIIKTK